MRFRSVWVAAACLAALALVLASCAPAASPTVTSTPTSSPTATSQPTTTPAPGQPEKPQYGGAIHFAWDLDSVPGFEPDAYTLPATGSNPVYEPLFIENIAKGPSGSREFGLDATYTPLEGMIGAIAESWEQTNLQTIIFHLRKNVYFQNKPPVNGRQVKAQDWVWSLYRTQAHPQGSWYKPPETPKEQLYNATALDDWTVEVKLPAPDPFVILRIGTDIQVMPHEVVDTYGSFKDWRNAAGTGPWMVGDVVTGTSVTYKKNPNYWQSDPLHPENKLPYADELRFQLIRDPATRLAALRTGKVEQLGGIKLEDASKLRDTNPELKSRKLYPVSTNTLYLRVNTTPFNDLRVRQAIFLAIDYEAIVRDFYKGEAEILTWPLMRTAGKAYTPMDELPTEPRISGSTVSCRDLFKYNPDKAKKLLADAGYPNGFTLQLWTAPAQFMSEHVPILTAYFEKVGIKTEVKMMEESALYGSTMTVTYPMMARVNWGNAVPLYAFEYAYRTKHPWNSVGVSDTYIDQTWDKIKMTLSADERNKMWKELNLYAMEQAYYSWVPTPYTYSFWQPWLKGYSGELQIGRLWNYTGFATYAWIDQDLKKSMGR